MSLPDSATLLELARVLRETADNPGALEDLIAFAGSPEPADVLRALARLDEIAAGAVEDDDPDWLRVREINAARRPVPSPEETPR